jgi:hypothetical protein
MNPTAPPIKGLIKLHKREHPIRPLVNWRGAPAYKLARLFTKNIRTLVPLPNRFKLQNTLDLINKLKGTPLNHHLALASLDISNLYTNIPVKETRNIIAQNLEKNQLVPQIRQELLNCHDTTTEQNYFTHKGEILIQKNVSQWAPRTQV